MLLDNLKRFATDNITVTAENGGARIQALEADELVSANQLDAERAGATARTHQTVPMNACTLLVRHIAGSNTRERTGILERVSALEAARLAGASLGVRASHGGLFVSHAGGFQFGLMCTNVGLVSCVSLRSLALQFRSSSAQLLVQFRLLCSRFAFSACLFGRFSFLSLQLPGRSRHSLVCCRVICSLRTHFHTLHFLGIENACSIIASNSTR